jgi:hypothetical protein
MSPPVKGLGRRPQCQLHRRDGPSSESLHRTCRTPLQGCWKSAYALRRVRPEQIKREGHMVQGHCLCGKVRFEVSGHLGSTRLCYCELCRRANGSAFSANVRVPASSYKLLSGAELIREYESSPGAFRAFCSSCGSPVYARVIGDPDYTRVRLGTLDTDANAIVGSLKTPLVRDHRRSASIRTSRSSEVRGASPQNHNRSLACLGDGGGRHPAHGRSGS